MKKKILIISLIIITLISCILYYTYAIDITMEETSSSEADLAYNININDTDGRSITVSPNTTKVFDIFLSSNNNGTIKYGFAYKETTSSGIEVKMLNTSLDKVEGTINNNETKKVTLVIDNNTSSNITYNIVPVTGYQNGGNLIIPSGYTLISGEYEFVTLGIDNSGANYPKLVENLIPVMHDGTNWVKADTTSSTSTYGWYDYTNKQWANAVLVSSTNRNTYVEAEAGTVIAESEVLAYYVWIPRYKYKVFNVAKTMGTDSYNAKTTGIDIVFEQGTASTGEIKCNNYSFASASSGATNETCSGTNGQYYTHPAFTFGDTELTGIWVGKFESASSNPSAGYGGGNSTTLTVRVKPNVASWRYNSVDNFYTVIKNMQSSGNEYGLSTDTSQVDSHMLKNIEWGAVAYLTHSDYGRCSNGRCSEIGINNYYSGRGSSMQYKTGCGANAGSSSSGTCNEYTTTLGMNASSTGNIYGIYDLSGGAYEYVMGNMSSGSGSYTYNAKSAGSNFSYSASTAKYIDTYAYGTSNGDQTAYNRARLGDATGEVVSSSYTAWNNDYAYFVDSSYPWFLRGGGYNSGSSAGVFRFHYDNGASILNDSARAALLAL